ncbi:DUF1700 domain-containing protein [Enterococcus sp. 2201sp1_2201st1_B8_2201SCRN_220225]|uniref:DUF1700 domain-containing protein n=1 Tax=unclassified Enterococcus TaxID=2608891 RepID=UPI0034A380A0
MDRITFINELSQALSYRVRPREVHQLVEYYDEMILDLMEDGLSETEAVAKLGNPEDLAQEAAGEVSDFEVEVPKRFNWLFVLIAVLGFPLWGSLLLAAVLVILSMYLVIWCLPFCTGVFGLAATFAGLVSVVFSSFALRDGLFVAITQLGIGVLFFGLGILSIIATIKISSVFVKISRNVTSRLFHGRRRVHL